LGGPDQQSERIEPRLPTDVRGIERVDDRRVISGIVHVVKSGCRWWYRPQLFWCACSHRRSERVAGLVDNPQLTRLRRYGVVLIFAHEQ
jgi:transposase